jgi:type I restriction enzyme R subunit
LKLARPKRADRRHSDDQKAWLAIRDHVAVNIEIRPQYLADAPEFAARGGIVRGRGHCSAPGCRHCSTS